MSASFPPPHSATAGSGPLADVAQLLLPAIRWDAELGFEGHRPMAERALELGVGGFILFGGTADAVSNLTRELRERSRIPLLIGADLERGAGQQFLGLSGLPPLAALGSLGDADAVRRAARLTAREALGAGVNWVYGPDCDLDAEPDNPIVGTRAFSGDPRVVAELASEWIDSCQREGVLACAKHFPGHGRTVGDSHMELPSVRASRETLEREDLLPFRAAIDAGVASVMTAHVAYPALDPSGRPATLSPAILGGLLRNDMGFDGLIVTDALIMEGVLEQHDEREASVRALEAGCDLLLYPADLEGVSRAIARAVESGRLTLEVITNASARRRRWAEWASRALAEQVTDEDRAWAESVCDRVVHTVRGTIPELGSQPDLVIVDDDLGSPYPPPSRQPFIDALEAAGHKARSIDSLDEESSSPVIVALFGDIRSWKGRPGYSPATRERVSSLVAAARSRNRAVLLVQFSHPRLLAELGEVPATVVCAWGGEPPMQRAAAHRISAHR